MAARPDTGLLARSRIMTLRGEVQVSDLHPGAQVITRDSGTAVLRAIRRRRITARRVRIRARSLGHSRPDHDAILPAGQMILIRDWRAQALFGVARALVPAARLADGEFVTILGTAPMIVHDLEFDRPHALYVDGLEVASTLAQPVTS